jgi:hypothetical protein
MPHPDSYLRHQRQRWTRHDAHLWIRPDAARFLPPGMDPAELYPTLARKPDAAKAAAFEAEVAAEVAAGYRLLAVLREEVAELRAELKRRRALEAKYSPSQPRVPSGDPRGGQWTDRSGGQGTVAGPSQDTGQSQDADLTQPMGNVDVGDVSGSSELTGLFNITPGETRVDGVQLAGGFYQVGSDGKLVTNADGSPYYAPGGHHDMPQGVFGKWNLDPETRQVFNRSTTGKVPEMLLRTSPDGVPSGHFWDGPNGAHGQYNAAVEELSTRFLEENKITPEQMTPNQARELLKQIRESDDPRIRDFNNAIRTLRRLYRLRPGRGNE